MAMKIENCEFDVSSGSAKYAVRVSESRLVLVFVEPGGIVSSDEIVSMVAQFDVDNLYVAGGQVHVFPAAPSSCCIWSWDRLEWVLQVDKGRVAAWGRIKSARDAALHLVWSRVRR
jgi:hypothetical protein